MTGIRETVLTARYRGKKKNKKRTHTLTHRRRENGLSGGGGERQRGVLRTVRLREVPDVQVTRMLQEMGDR